MSEREQVLQLQKEAEERKSKAAQDAQKRNAEAKDAEANRLATDNRKTDEIRAFCEEAFKDVNLATGQEVKVSITSGSDLHNNIPRDGVDYVGLSVQFWAFDNNHYRLPLVLCRYRGSYELAIGHGNMQLHHGDFESFKMAVKHAVANVGESEFESLIAEAKVKAKVRPLARRR